jgi:hypothetical protein
MVRIHGTAAQLPAFTKFCMEVGPGFVGVLASLATAYCVWVWFRKAESRPSWVSFLAAATGSLLLVTLPVVVGIYLALVNALNSLGAN